VSWLWGTTVRRWRAQWRLLASVLAVTLLSCTLVTALALLATTTEQNGVSRTLATLPDASSRIDITVLDASGTPVDFESLAEKTVHGILVPSASLETTGRYFTALDEADLPSSNPAYGYFAELDGVESEATLIEGSWPTSVSTVAIPESAARSFGLELGDNIRVGDDTVAIVAVYSIDDRASDYWEQDALYGVGDDPAFPRPNVTSYEPIHAFGPLIVAPDGFAELGLAMSVVDLDIVPALGSTTVDELAPLAERLEDADVDVRQALRGSGSSTVYESRLAETVGNVARGLIVTRSTVVVVSLLLLVLAVAAIGQTARLLAEARATDRDLMRSRGASTRHVLSFSLLEAGLVGLVTAVLSPLLASLVYAAFASHPSVIAAGLPPTAPPGPLTWAVAAATAIVFVGVLIAPLLGKGSAAADSARRRTRQRATRTGVDLALLVLAGVAYWQLQAYRAPVDGDATVTVDPVLVAGPAIVLLAGAFACIRFLPLVARLIAYFGDHARGIVLPLAAWEIGRRPARASTAVLLLSLALAVGTFSVSFLATWQQSQTDQADFAVGAPGRALTDPGGGSPVLRLTGRIGVPDISSAAYGEAARVLALGAGARDLLDRGRVGELGGTAIREALDAPLSAPIALDLPSSPEKITATVLVGEPGSDLDEMTANVGLVLEDGSGLLHLVALGDTPLDGLEHEFAAETTLESAKLVGLTMSLSGGSPRNGPVATSVIIQKLAVGGETIELSVPEGWTLGSGNAFTPEPTLTDEGLGLNLAMPGEAVGGTSRYFLVGWDPVTSVPAVVPGTLAQPLGLAVGGTVGLYVRGAVVVLDVEGTTELIPGVANIASLGSATRDTFPVVVADHARLARALVQVGVDGTLADEWWADVPKGEGDAFVAANRGAVAAEVLARSMQESPLRITTPIALILAIIAGGLLAAMGFAMHTVTSLRSRRLELAQLGALGVPRAKLLTLVTAESLIVGALGAVFGALIGVLLALLIGPIVAVSPTGEQPVPEVVVVIPWSGILVLDVGIALVLALVVVAVARGRAFAHPAELLRWGGE